MRGSAYQIVSDAIDALPDPPRVKPMLTDNLLEKAALKGSLELCKMAFDLGATGNLGNPPPTDAFDLRALLDSPPAKVLEAAICGGSLECVQFVFPKVSAHCWRNGASLSNIFMLVVECCDPVPIMRYLLEDAKWSLWDWNPNFYAPGTRLPDWAWDMQHGLAARQLGTRAVERALRHAGVHKDIVPIIVGWIKKSGLEKWKLQ